MRKTAYFLIACLLVSSSFGLVSADSSKNIPENVQATGVHDSLAAALAHADLITALSAEGHLLYLLQLTLHSPQPALICQHLILTKKMQPFLTFLHTMFILVLLMLRMSQTA